MTFSPSERHCSCLEANVQLIVPIHKPVTLATKRRQSALGTIDKDLIYNLSDFDRRLPREEANPERSDCVACAPCVHLRLVPVADLLLPWWRGPADRALADPGLSDRPS